MFPLKSVEIHSLSSKTLFSLKYLTAVIQLLFASSKPLVTFRFLLAF